MQPLQKKHLGILEKFHDILANAKKQVTKHKFKRILYSITYDTAIMCYLLKAAEY